MPLIGTEGEAGYEIQVGTEGQTEVERLAPKFKQASQVGTEGQTGPC